MQKKSSPKNPSRRNAIKAAAAGAATLAFPAVWTSVRAAANKRIVVRDDGGIYSKAYGAVFLASLPPAPRTRDIRRAVAFLAASAAK